MKLRPLILPILLLMLCPAVDGREQTVPTGAVSSNTVSNNTVPNNTVSTGIDVIVGDKFRQLSGARIGLITNHTGVAGNGHSTIRLLHQASNVKLVRIFSPEHGIEGKLDIPLIDDSSDTTTGIPVVSLYGAVKRPTADMLSDIDTLVFDIQDIGTRFYTYISTMGNAMRAAADHNIRFVILDRPNPINGLDVAGPVLDDGLQSFVGFHLIPIRHGMTTGELALMFEAELELDMNLDIVRVTGWRRRDFFDDTGMTWINPSPNMRSPTQALLYPGIGLLETTNLSVGRGTATPFEVFGAPWLDGDSFTDKLNAIKLPGVSFSSIRFTPDASKFVGESCQGVRITITDRNVFEPLSTGFAIAHRLRLDYPEKWQLKAYLRLLGNSKVFEALKAGHTVAEMEAGYKTGLDAFIKRRANYLLYK